MFIIDAERETIYNADQLSYIYPCNNGINGRLSNGEGVILGNYKSPERANEVFKEMLNAAFPPSIELPFAATEGDCYYMPEV